VAWALGELGAQLEDVTLRVRVVELLIGALRDSDRHVRQTAAEALGRIGTPEALAALREYEAGKR
jgi:HEAT repeat protein